MTPTAAQQTRRIPGWMVRATIVLVTVAAASPLAWWVYRKVKRTVAVRGHVSLQVQKGTYYRGHDLLGYALTPGAHYVQFSIGDETGGKFVLVGPDGCKVTSMKLLDETHGRSSGWPGAPSSPVTR